MECVAAGASREVAGRVRAGFRSRYGGPAAVVARAPGRVNLIGEHTDYNAGLCLPIALPHATYVAAAPRSDDLVAAVSAQVDGPDRAWLGRPEEATGWAAYAAGVVWALREAGVDVPGLDLAVDSTLPVGAGLSSSAALGCAVATAVSGIVGPLPADLRERAAFRAETEVAGAPTGGMDQAVAVHARPGRALLLDFGTGARELVPWAPAGHTLLVVDTRVAHALVDGEYAARRRDCARACRELGVASLREAEAPAGDLPWQRRARHVVTENARVRAFVDAATGGDWSAAGALMTASHVSLRDDYEVSCPELDTVVDAALGAGAVGARMTGGGFGGCAIALVPQARASGVLAEVDARFAARGWRAPAYLLAEASGPAEVLPAE